MTALQSLGAPCRSGALSEEPSPTQEEIVGLLLVDDDKEEDAATTTTTTTSTTTTTTTGPASPPRRRRRWRRRLVLTGLVAMVLLLVLVRQIRHPTPIPFGSCQDCFCIPERGQTCPWERQPVQPLHEDLATKLRALQWDNPVTLHHAKQPVRDCDPYQQENCGLSVDVHQEDAHEAVCVVEYHDTVTPGFVQESNAPSSELPFCSALSYSIRTFFGSAAAAQAQGLVVTHTGACGACSSLQDEAVYRERGAALRHDATTCGLLGKFRGPGHGEACFQALGMTETCARVWYYNTRYTDQECWNVCLPFALQGQDPNGAHDMCPLAECLACDETKAGPLFKRFAGRTRRNSGLLSDIARSCSDLVFLRPTEPPCRLEQEEESVHGALKQETLLVSPQLRGVPPATQEISTTSSTNTTPHESRPWLFPSHYAILNALLPIARIPRPFDPDRAKAAAKVSVARRRRALKPPSSSSRIPRR